MCDLSCEVRDDLLFGRLHLFPLSELSTLHVTFVDILYIFDDINSLTESNLPLTLFVICLMLFILRVLHVFMTCI